MDIAFKSRQAVGEQRIKIEPQAIGGQVCQATSVKRNRVLPKMGVKFLIALAATPALAEMPCQDFTRGYILQDSDVLGEAQEIAHPWLDADAMLMTKSGVPRPKEFLGVLHMEQLARECKALPTDTVDRIVATRLKSARKQLAELAEKKAPEPPAPLPAAPPAALGKDTAALSAEQRSAIADHARQCYSSSTNSAPNLDKQRVLLTVATDAGGIVRRAKVAGDDVSRMTDPRFRAFANRVMAAFLDPHCANLPLPNNVLGRINVLTFRFSP
jgi:hypothetical protein